jgi:hypothetical protein
MNINSKIKIIYKYLAVILIFGLSNFLTRTHAENYSIEEFIMHLANKATWPDLI